MKYFHQHQNKLNNLTSNLKISGVFLLLLSSIFTTPMAIAGGPATVASCSGIKTAYRILGTVCEKNHAKINHTPQNEKERRDTLIARKKVLIIFRQASVCNGVDGANTKAQKSFLADEDGHLECLERLELLNKERRHT